MVQPGLGLSRLQRRVMLVSIVECRSIASPVFGRESTRTGSAQHLAPAALHSLPLALALSQFRRSTRPQDVHLVPGTFNSSPGRSTCSATCMIAPRASQCLGVICRGEEGVQQRQMNACTAPPLPITMLHTQQTQLTEHGHFGQ